MGKAKISVIVPVYNTENYLRQCLDSVLNQSFRDFEVVVVIDASPDESIDIVRNYQKSDERIVIINKEVNEGLSAARNTGVESSSGDYVVHLDSDDFWIDNNMLQDLYEIAEVDGCDILAFDGYKYEDGEFVSPIVNRSNLVNGCFNEDRVLWDYRAVFLFVFRKEFLVNNNLSFLEGISLGEDGVFVSAALVLAQKVSSTHKRFYAYRNYSSSMMNKKWTIEQFMEEETSSQVISDTISINSDALNAYLFYRMVLYWASKIAVKAKLELSKSERYKLYAHARNNFIKTDVSFLEGRSRLKRSKLLREYFVSSDFNKIDRYIDEVNCLTVTSKFSIGCVLHSLRKFIMSYLQSFRSLARFKCYLMHTPLLMVGWCLRNIKFKEKQFVNFEKLDEFGFSLSNSDRYAGVSAMLRVRNEERRIESCIESIVDVFDEIVVVDNASSDSTLEIVRSLINSKKYAEKIKVFSYPHEIARCGYENSSTPADSVHSLAYYYNWSLSKCNYSMVCKWDADMLLATSPETRARFSRFLSDCVNKKVWVLGQFPIQTIYIDEDGVSYVAQGEINGEVRVFPNSPFVYFKKAEQWEVIASELYIPRCYLDDVCVYEIKDVADDEFSHWTSVSFKDDRKAREYRNYMRVKNNWHKSNSLDFIPSGDL